MDYLPNIKNATLLSVEDVLTYTTADLRKYLGWWWVKSSSFYPSAAAIVDFDGAIYYSKEYSNNIYYVRPVLEIELDPNKFNHIGGYFLFGNKVFKIISDNLAFCVEDIGRSCFRANSDAEDAHTYEASDIKKFIDAWFAEAMQEAESLRHLQ